VSANVKVIDPNITTGLLVGRSVLTIGERLSEFFPRIRLKKAHADFISPNYIYCTPLFVMRMKMLQYPVYVWTVNRIKIAKYLNLLNVNGIITDNPDIVNCTNLKKPR
jgi:glycerophosphoryl diester phosphodiesterase